MEVFARRFWRRNESAASIVQLSVRRFSDKLDLSMTSLGFPVAIGPVRHQDRWRAAEGDDFHAEEETLAYEST